MDYMTGMVVIVAMIVGCVVYGLTLLAKGKASERQIRHTEYNSRLPLDHTESMLKIAANRDIEVAKATKKEPVKVIEN